MKKKNQEIVFNLKFIEKTAPDKRAEYPNVSVQKPYYPNTPLDDFPICYFQETKKVEEVEKPTQVFDSPDFFVSPIIGTQNNQIQTGEQSQRPREVYEEFSVEGETKPQTKAEIKKSFDLLDNQD